MSKQRIFRIDLPLPPKELSPNWRGHWAQKAKAVKRYRELAHALSLANLRDRWPAALCQCTFTFKDARQRDKDNLLASMKAAFDGIADSGAVANDSGITHLPVLVQVDKANPGVAVQMCKQVRALHGVEVEI